MKHWSKYCIFLLWLVTGFLMGAPCAMSADDSGSDLRKTKSILTMDLGLKAGYRVDQLDWNIAGNTAGTGPNVLSELTWDDLEIYQLQLDSGLTFGNRQRDGYLYHLRGMLGWGSIYDGTNQDSDYAGDDRTLEFSRSNNLADDGDVFDFSVGTGLKLSSRNEKWALLPLVGYSYHEQNLRISDGYQTVSEQDIADAAFGPGRINLPPLGPILGLDSSYETQWWGPWMGMEFSYHPTERWKLIGNFEYHWADYEGTANWNLRTDLAHPVSFRHWADGNGLVLGFVLDGKLSNAWSCNLTTNYQDWQTDSGSDVVYKNNGGTSGTRLNEVNWESFSTMAGVTRRF